MGVQQVAPEDLGDPVQEKPKAETPGSAVLCVGRREPWNCNLYEVAKSSTYSLPVCLYVKYDYSIQLVSETLEILTPP